MKKILKAMGVALICVVALLLIATTVIGMGAILIAMGMNAFLAVAIGALFALFCLVTVDYYLNDK